MYLNELRIVALIKADDWDTEFTYESIMQRLASFKTPSELLVYAFVFVCEPNGHPGKKMIRTVLPYFAPLEDTEVSEFWKSVRMAAMHPYLYKEDLFIP